MSSHAHPESQQVATWGATGMLTHLRHGHPEVSVPMSWGRAELHRAHLEAHMGTTSVSTAPAPEITCTEAHLGLATTGAMLEEIRTRIDLGHCGLDYRTVDGDEGD